MKEYTILEGVTPADLEYIDILAMDEDGRVALMPTEVWREIDPKHLRAWMHWKARYVIPTVELVLFLKVLIGEMKAIEIASGNADLGYHLGIPETDSFIQSRVPQVIDFYKATGQPPTRPREGYTFEAPAMAAVEWFKAEVVVAAWATEFSLVEQAERNTSPYGVRELDIIPRVRKYIHIGNTDIHGKKTALTEFGDRLTVRYDSEDMVVSRGDQDKNVIYIWETPDGST